MSSYALRALLCCTLIGSVSLQEIISELIFFQELRLPHVLPLREAHWNFNPSEVLDAFLQLLLWGHLLLGRFPLPCHGVTRPRGPHTKQVSSPGDWGRTLFHRPVQSLDVGLAGDRTHDDRFLGRAGFWLGLGTGSGELVEGSAALTLALALVTLAAAVAVRRRPSGWATLKTQSHKTHKMSTEHIWAKNKNSQNDNRSQIVSHFGSQCNFAVGIRLQSPIKNPDVWNPITKVKELKWAKIFFIFPFMQFNQYSYYKYPSNGTDVSHFTQVDAHATI